MNKPELIALIKANLHILNSSDSFEEANKWCNDNKHLAPFIVIIDPNGVTNTI